ncbi:MAG TPA: hypothetical protein VI248_24070 [Kineosporiaceae bacterium]
MREKRVLAWGATGAAAAAVLLTAACGGKDVTFTPVAANSTAVIRPADGSPSSAGGGPGSSSAAAATTPSNVEITRQGGTVCVRSKDMGSQACVSDHGTAVVNGIVIVDGKVVGTSGSSGASVAVNGGSVAVNGGSVVVGDNPAPVATSGQVSLLGAVRWRGSASGECRRRGEVRHAVVTLGNGGRLGIDVVGTGVVRIELASGGDTYSGNWVGDNGFVTLAERSLKVDGVSVGRGSHAVQVTASLDC